MERIVPGDRSRSWGPRQTQLEQAILDLLREVSRSFYLTLRVLPRAIRPQMSLAYLFARATDTIADTELVPLPQRLEALRALRDRILGMRTAPLDFAQLSRRQESTAERTLLERVEDLVAVLGHYGAADQRRIRDVLETITSGQALDLERFAGANAQRIVALKTPEELEDYTYRVAGCVGEFWTRMCVAHLLPGAPVEDATLLANGIRFGRGLQLVNILRDLPADLRKGRCYLPAGQLSAHGLAPADLLAPANEPRLRPVFDAWLAAAEAHLAAGWDYTNTLPWRLVRVRLACAWPILIGRKTLSRLRHESVLDPSRRIKITRVELRDVMLRSVLYYPLPGLWRAQFQRAGE